MRDSHSKWSGLMGKEGDDGLRTVECLRGRLLAERVASKAAKDQVEQLSLKLEELEKQLAIEIKSRDKAEKRLKKALKKLKSLKLLDDSGRVELSRSSVSSSECVPGGGHRRLEGWKPDSENVETKQCGRMEQKEEVVIHGDAISDIPSIDYSVLQSGSQEGSWSSVGTAQSHNKEDPLCQCRSPRDDPRQHCGNDKELETAEHQTEKYEDTSLALVPINMWSCSEAKKPDTRNNAQEVLVALRHVRHQLQNSLSRRALYGQ